MRGVPACRLLGAVMVVATISACAGVRDSTPVREQEPLSTPTTGHVVGAPDANGIESSEPWGAMAVAWWEAMGTAAAEGAEHMVSFLDAELVWEGRVTQELTHGEDEWVSVQLARYAGSYPWRDIEFLVSADEILGWFSMPMDLVDIGFLDRMALGPDGVSRWVTAGSFRACRTYDPWRCEFDFEEFVGRYVAFWNGSDDVDVGSIYGSGATISDTLVGESLSGLDAISRSVGSGVWPDVGPMELLSQGEVDESAVFWAPSDAAWADLEEVRFLIQVDDGSDCPGLMGVAMAVEEQRVRWERRYHDIESVRRCFDPDRLQAGWWDEIETPATMVVEHTGTVSYGPVDVDVYNGIPALDGFVRWGFDRFEAAGLPPPAGVNSVTFLKARVTCFDLRGMAVMGGAETSITLCAGPDDICLDEPCREWSARHRQAWLHELAHPWLVEHVDEQTRDRFLDVVGLPRWSDQADPWRERGMERAADTIARGLMDEPVTLISEIHGDCAARDAGFQVLTGTDPIAPCTEGRSLQDR